MAGDRYTVRRIAAVAVRRYRVYEDGSALTRSMSYSKARRIADDLNDGVARRRFAREVRDELAATRAEIDATRVARLKVGH